MKIAIILITLLINSAYAAQFSETENFKSYSLSKISSMAEKLSQDTSSGDFNFHHWGVKIIYKKPSEKIEKSIKQMIYTVYTGWSAPEEVNVKHIEQDKAIEEISQMQEELTEYYNEWDHDEQATKELNAKFNSLKNFLKRDFKNLRYYESNHGNSFGGASGVVIYNKRTKEVKFLEAVWSE